MRWTDPTLRTTLRPDAVRSSFWIGGGSADPVARTVDRVAFWKLGPEGKPDRDGLKAPVEAPPGSSARALNGVFVIVA